MDSIRSALIVATDQYTDPRLRRLRAPASDARALAEVLRDPRIGDFEVRTLLNEPAHVVNLAVEEFFADRRPSDLLLVHFSGHGIKDEDGELYLAASNTVLGRLGGTAVAAEFISRRMTRSRSRRVVLLLDCCYAGAFERGLVARAAAEMEIKQRFGGRGRAVITASSAMEYAFEAGELAGAREVPPSVFTSALVEGLETGEADQDQDGLVGLDELYDYVYDKVRAATPNQTPGKWAFGVEGELHIARRARPVTRPAPLPPELQQAMESPLAGVRAGAVQELAAVLHGRHAGMALTARLALEQFTGDDSRAVAAAATTALGVQPLPVPPRPSPPELTLSDTVIDLGQIPLHGEPPERRVRIGNAGGGDLNARAATSASWLKLRQAEDELMVAVDTSAAGDYEGIITVDSDGGTAIVRVHARVGPDMRPAFWAPATTHPKPVPEPPAGAQSGRRQDPALAMTSSATADAIPPTAGTSLTPANSVSGHTAEGHDPAAPDHPQPQIIPQPEFSWPAADRTSEEVVPADPAAAATIDPVFGGGPRHDADISSPAPIMTGPARSGPSADDGTGATRPTRTAADQDTHAAVATMGSDDDGARAAWRSPRRLLVIALASAARTMRPRRRRWPIVTTSLAVLLLAVVIGGYVAWRWSQDQYYIGADSNGQVLIYRGVNQRIAGVSLSRPYKPTGIQLAQVPAPYQQTLRATDAASSLHDAQAIVTNVRSAVTTCQQQYTALQGWVQQENAYQAALAQFNKAKKPAKDKPKPPPARPAQPAPMCPASTAFGIPASALVPAAAGSS